MSRFSRRTFPKTIFQRMGAHRRVERIRRRSARFVSVESLEGRIVLSNYLVTNTSYGIPGSLDAAITAAITAGDSEAYIQFNLAENSTISLTASDTSGVTGFGPTAYLISGTGVNITIDGLTSPGLTIDGGNAIRPFAVISSASLTIKGLTVAGGLAQGGAGGDGGLNSGGGGGGAGLGGGIYIDGGAFTADGVTFVNNAARGGVGGAAGTGSGAGGGGGGGAVGEDGQSGMAGGMGAVGGGQGGETNEPGGSGSFGGGGGGGGNDGALGFTGGAGGFGGGGGGAGSQFTNSYGVGGAGGFGGGAGGGDGLSGSSAGGGGGGAGLGGAIFSTGGSVTLINSTLTQNDAIGGAGGAGLIKGDDGWGYGGAFFARNTTIQVANTTFAANDVTINDGPNGKASDVFILGDANSSAYTATIVNSIFGQSLTSVVHEFNSETINGGVAADLSASRINFFYHDPQYEGMPHWTISYSGDLKLAPLADNGGPTKTIGLLPDSPARENGILASYPGTMSWIDIDQRGLVRSYPYDVGAYTVKSGAAISLNDASLDLGSSTRGTPGVSLAFEVSGAQLVSDIVVTSPNGVELSLDGEVWGSTVTIPWNGRPVDGGTVFARISASARPGTITGKISIRSAQDAFGSISISGLVNRQVTSYVVTDGSDAAGSALDVTLRYAIEQAVANSEIATITFAPEMANLVNGKITLTTADPDLGYGGTAFIIDEASLVIDATAYPGLSIDGEGALRPFVVTASASLTLKNLMLFGGLAQGAAGGESENGGGGGGAAGLGGGVYVDGGTFVADGVTFSNNTAKGGTGGSSTSDVYVGDSGGDGGGWFGGEGRSYGDNGGGGGFGGGGGGGGPTYGWGGSGGAGGFGGGGGGGGGKVLNIDGAASGGIGGFGGGTGGLGNASPMGGGGGGGAGLGGAIFANGGSISLVNSTLTGNAAIGGAGGAGLNAGTAGAGLGGALFARNATVQIIHSTFSSNTVTNGDENDGDAAHVCLLGDDNPSAYTATIVDSIFGQGGISTINDFVSSETNGGLAATFGNSSNNILSNNPGSGGLPGDAVIFVGDPLLGNLTNNGGPTWTMALLPGSPAIGAGMAVAYPGTMTPITNDQRGVTRTNHDVGALAFSSVTISGGPLSLGVVPTGTASTSHPFTVAGSQLSEGILITSPTGVEISTDGSSWHSSISLPPSAGIVSTTTIYARIKSTASLGPIFGAISVVSTSVADQEVVVAGFVESLITVSPGSLPNAVAGTFYSQQLTATGGSGSGYVFSATGLPPGLTLGSDGLLSGIPETPVGSPFSLTVSVTDNYQISRSVNYTLVVEKVQTSSSSINASNEVVVSGQEVVLTARFTAVGLGAVPMTGTVDFYDGETYLGTAPIVPLGGPEASHAALIAGTPAVTVSGQASLPTSGLSVGSHVITAIYSGNEVYATATSQSSVSVNVLPSATIAGPELVGLSRYGFRARSTVLVLYFNGPLEASRSQNTANYLISDPSGRRIAVSSATYDPSALTVTLVPSGKLDIRRVYRLELIGSGTTGLAGASGIPLGGSSNGMSGRNFQTRISWTALAAPGSLPAIRFIDGQPHGYTGGFRRYLNAVLRATKAATHSGARVIWFRQVNLLGGLASGRSH